MNARWFITNIFIVLMSFAPLHVSAKRKALITSASQLSTNSQLNSGSGVSNLIDGNVNTIYQSLAGENMTEAPYIEIALNEPLDLAADEDFIVSVLRNNAFGSKHPTTFEVEGKTGADGQWEYLCNIYLLFRGKGTTEYSSRVHTDKAYTHLRFTVTANNSRHRNSKGYREMAMSGFQLYKLKKTDNYTNILKDRLHLIDDYIDDYKDYTFRHTTGAIAVENRGAVSANWCDWSGWSPDGVWQKDVDVLEQNGIEMPDYTMLSSETDESYVLDAGQKRQPTHVMEHILYAVPGDVIVLYPYYELADKSMYNENFSHWYDYRTGSNLVVNTVEGDESTATDLLDFLADPWKIVRTDKCGYFGGGVVTMKEDNPNSDFTIATPEDWIAYVKLTKSSGGCTKSARLIADIDFSGYDNIEPIGWEYFGVHIYRATFNGNGHKISNLNMHSDKYAVGLFGALGNGSCVMNLVIDGSCSFKGRKNVGSLAGCYSNWDGSAKTVKNVVSYATVEATEMNAGGLLGNHEEGYFPMNVIENCFVGGTVRAPKNCGAVIGGDNKGDTKCNNIMRNTVADAIVEDGEGKNRWSAVSYSVENCYATKDYQYADDIAYKGTVTKVAEDWLQTDTDAALALLGSGWELGADGTVVPGLAVIPQQQKAADRTYGTYATFFCPRDPMKKEQYSLPFRDGDNGEFVIAADFSQSFSMDRNLNADEKEFVEPIIACRHIFRIRDGKQFADEFSATPEANARYIKKNMRYVSARAGHTFNIRLDSPVPKQPSSDNGLTPRSKYYYKISDTDYRRVCTMRIKVLDADTRQEVTDDKIKFEFYEESRFQGQGKRSLNGVDYYVGGSGGEYYRMLKCDNPAEGRYLVQIIGRDINGNDIKIVDTDTDLIVMEMQVTFLPDKGASLLTEAELYGNDKYKHAREEELVKSYGAPADSINFDQYRALDKLDNFRDYVEKNSLGNSYIKWPVRWSESNYCFGYDKRYDFNMYMIADHCSVTGYARTSSSWVNDDGTKGLYDRLYYKSRRQYPDDPSKWSRGYFYFVNAASDPGVMTTLSVDDLCLGSTIYVSAWIAELSDRAETANVAFNFVAVLNDENSTDENGQPKAGERVVLHTYISGSVPCPGMPGDDNRECRGQWMNVYYSFVPNYSETGIKPEDVHHYELELDNNGKSSDGADYIIDNIRIYVVKPIIYASQLTPVCDDKTFTASVKVESPFNVMLQVLGLTESTSEESGIDVDLYYTVMDKQAFDERYEYYRSVGDPEPGIRAYAESVLHYDYNSTGDDSQTYGKLSFNTCFDKNELYPDNAHASTIAYRTIGEDGERLIVFNTKMEDERLSSGKEYYISIFPLYGTLDEGYTPGWADFDILGPCARMCVFRIKPTSVVKIDGEMRQDVDNIVCCEGQSPVVQINLWGTNPDSGELEEVVKNARLDWFSGKYSDFASYEEDGVRLSDAMAQFRALYPDATNCDVEASGDFSQAMLDMIRRLTTEKDSQTGRPLLTLSKSSYVFTKTTINEGEYAYVYVVAIPIDYIDGNSILCTQSTEVRIKVENHAPVLNHGIREGIPYPENMDDVPLRIGLSQLKAVSAAEGTDLKAHEKSLNVPVRRVVNAMEDATAMRVISGSPYVCLVETNDPDYEDLGTVSQPDGSGAEEETGMLLAVGEVVGMTADIGGSDNIFNVVFYDSFRFKEGYYYRMRFMFEENASGADMAGDGGVVCNGQDVFTLKVVPAYQRWTGKASATNKNWNNDANWTRVAMSELNPTGDRQTGLTDFVTDGSNAQTFSYAPLDFTKVIIPAVAKFPHLDSVESDDLSSSYDDADNVYWSKSPSTTNAGEATSGIEFDMAAYNGNGGVNCRPWYANTCGEIHFRPNSEIMSQQYLVYDRAWVDVAAKPGRWYTLASPLKTVYAGDFYLPSDNARQEKDLFTDITFSYGAYNRFKPAVFQRSWNRSRTTVFEIGGGSSNVAVGADWSHVYNDVEEHYGLGTGFSIKTDVSSLGGDIDEVLFRLPKSDASYYYFSQDDTPQYGNETTVDRTDNFRLNDVKGSIRATSAGDNLYFLVGNPFMSHLDMKEFLARNSAKIYPKYWILTEGSQKMAVFDQNADGFVGSSDGYVAPLQGFFVEAKPGAAVAGGAADDKVKLELDYDEPMMCVWPFSADGSLKVASRGDVGGGSMVISAVSGGEVVSQAFINVSPHATRSYDNNEDAALIDHSVIGLDTSVYTVASGKAVAINATDDVEGTEIGLISSAGATTTLLFEGTGSAPDMSLYDVASGESLPLYDGMEYQVTGPVSGRLFLTAGAGSVVDGAGAMDVRVDGQMVKVFAGQVGDRLDVNVYSTTGVCVLSQSEPSGVAEFSLCPGVYVVEASDRSESLVRKIVIK